MLSEVIIFVVAVVSHWQSYVTGGAVAGIVIFVERVFDWKMPKWAFVAVFGGVFLLVSFFLAWRDQYHEAQKVPTLQQQVQGQERQIADLKAKPPQLQVNMPPAVVNIPSQMAYMAVTGLGVVATEYKVGGRWAVSGACKNISPSIIAENTACVRGVRVVDTALNSLKQPVVSEAVQEKTWKQFQRDISSTEISRRSYGPGESYFGTVFSPIVDDKGDKEFRNGSKTILFLAEYSWKDGVGTHTNEVCTWLQVYPEMFTGPGTIAGNAIITWNGCKNHNGLKR
jgi:hypothetical protein